MWVGVCLQAWQNERFAPELLEHKTEVVDCILDQIKEMVCKCTYMYGCCRQPYSRTHTKPRSQPLLPHMVNY